MNIGPKRFKALALPFLISAALLLALGGCSDDPVTTSSMPFTNDDGIAEMTGVPGFPNGIAGGDTSVNVTLPVDTDTATVDVYIHTYPDKAFTVGSANNQSVTPGSTNTIAVTTASVNSNQQYYIEMVTCVAATPNCQYLVTLSPNDTGYFNLGSGKYQKNAMDNSTGKDTNVDIPEVLAN